jgi:hypothetical protein
MRSPETLIFTVALIFRIALGFFYTQDYLMSDSTDYHNVAVNMTKGIGYSERTEPPYYPYFYREPAHPLWLTSLYGLYQLFGGNVHYLSQPFNIEQNPEVTFARVFQSVLGSATCLLFFILIRKFLRPKLAFSIGLLCAIYIPHALFSAMLMRENLQTFLCVLASLALVTYGRAPSFLPLAVLGLTIGALSMTLQIMIFFFPIAVVFLWWTRRHVIREVLLHTLILAGVITLAISPWLIRSYRATEDIRVLKSMGTSTTYELMDYLTALTMLRNQGLISNDSVHSFLHSWYPLPDSVKFRLSFSGVLSERAADIRQTITSRPSFQSEVRRYIGTFRAGWLESFWVVKQDNGRLHFKPHTIYLRKRQYVLFVLLIPAFVVGYLALPAALIFFRRLFLLMPMFVFFIPWSARIGIETRRIVPVHFFIIMLGVLGLCYIVLRFRRVSDTAAKSRLLLDAENGSE